MYIRINERKKIFTEVVSVISVFGALKKLCVSSKMYCVVWFSRGEGALLFKYVWIVMARSSKVPFAATLVSLHFFYWYSTKISNGIVQFIHCVVWFKFYIFSMVILLNSFFFHCHHLQILLSIFVWNSKLRNKTISTFYHCIEYVNRIQNASHIFRLFFTLYPLCTVSYQLIYQKHNNYKKKKTTTLPHNHKCTRANPHEQIIFYLASHALSNSIHVFRHLGRVFFCCQFLMWIFYSILLDRRFSVCFCLFVTTLEFCFVW